MRKTDRMQETSDLQEARIRQVEGVVRQIYEGQTTYARALHEQSVWIKRLAERQNDVEQRLDRVEQRLDRVERRLDKVEQRLDKVEQRLDKVEQRLDKVEQRLEGMDLRLEGMDLRLQSVEARLESLETQSGQMLELLTLALDDLSFLKQILKPGD